MTEKYLPIEDLANHLSVKVSTIRQWVKQGHIPTSSYLKVGQTYRFDIPSVVNALKASDTKVADDESVFEVVDEGQQGSFEYQDTPVDS